MSKTVDAAELEDRDPNTLSHHLQVTWEDVIGEPDDIRSPECAWRTSNRCFHLSRNFCYICLSIVIAPITALCLGCCFACISFKHIWCLNPCLRLWTITCSMTRSFCLTCTQATISPVMYAVGQVFSSVNIRLHNQPEDLASKKDVHLI